MIGPAHTDIQITIKDQEDQIVPIGSRVHEVLKNPIASNGLHVLGAIVNNDVASLSYPLEVHSTIKFITLMDRHGRKMYRRSVSFLLAKTVKELFPTADFSVNHALGPGYYCTCEIEEKPITETQLDAIRLRMNELVEQDLPIQRTKVDYEAALAKLEEEGQMDKHGLLQYVNPPKINVYHCDGFTDIAHGPFAGSTAGLKFFQLIPYAPGFVVQFPSHKNPPEFDEFHPQPNLFKVFTSHKAWGKALGVQTVSQLNKLNIDGNLEEFIQISEARHEKQIALLADQVKERVNDIRYVLIAGPSSAGKTTFSKRFGTQLKVNGLFPVTVAVDNYFVEREQTPIDENGKPDYEHIESIDLELINRDLQALMRGEPVVIPRFDFIQGRKIFDEKNTLQLRSDQVIVMEGIHCLNPRLTQTLDDDRKFRIYLSALTQLNLDHNNRISTTDNRLMRRMLRDHQFRGHSVLDTLKMWSSVRRGEDRWIFPFQELADATFNSALDYELAILRPLVEPLLCEVKPRHEEYAEARRLQDFMTSIVGHSHECVPHDSLLREFIGKSSFAY